MPFQSSSTNIFWRDALPDTQQAERLNEKVSHEGRGKRGHITCKEVGPCPDRGRDDPSAPAHCRRTSCISPNPPVLTIILTLI